jgi:dynein assembly factor 3, axonemal
MEALGFISFWGFSPSIDFLVNTDLDLAKDDRDINVLISECSDIRHILKTLADNLPLPNKREHTLNIYIHEKNRENLCRAILFLTLLCET